MPSANHAVLALLRTDPMSAFSKFGFVTSTKVYTAGELSGGACSVECSLLNDNVYQLEAGPHMGGDWYYPYNNSSNHGGVGMCTVPFNQADGSVVITGGMNGCSLVVNRNADGFQFIHDLNSCSLGGQMDLSIGEAVCTVSPRDYDLLNSGHFAAISYLEGAGRSKPNSKPYWSVYIIAVKNAGRWKVFASHILNITSENHSVLGSKYFSKTYETYRGSVSPWIASFEDA